MKKSDKVVTKSHKKPQTSEEATNQCKQTQTCKNKDKLVYTNS